MITEVVGGPRESRTSLTWHAFLVALLWCASASAAAAGPIAFTTFSTQYNEDPFWTFATDPTSGAYYARLGYGDQGQQLRAYSTLAAFAADAPTNSVILQGTGGFGTYWTGSGGDLFARSSRNGTDVTRWNAASGAVELIRASVPNMGGQNGIHTFDWGGYSGVNLMQDSTGMYLFGRNVSTSSWQLNRIDQNLNILGTVNYAPDDPSLGFAFMVNGSLYSGPNYNQNRVTRRLDFATGAVTNVDFTLDGLGSSLYLSSMFYDPTTDTLFAWNTQSRTLYSAAHVSDQLGVPSTPVPEPSSLLLLSSGGIGLTAFCRRRRRQI